MTETLLPSRLSKKDIAARERLIFALDVSTYDQARALISVLGDSVSFYKLGLEVFMSGDYFGLARELIEDGKRVFVDLKFFDVPETVARAVKAARRIGASFVTVHGNDGMLAAAVRERGDLKLLAVTVLTSLDQADLDALGFQVHLETLVLSRAKRAIALGCDGVISSGLEAAALRDAHGESFLIVAPGIRPLSNDDDHKRVVTPEDAFHNGADHIVVGRPIRDAADPRAAAEALQATIAELFPG